MTNGMLRAALVLAALSIFAATSVFGADANAPAEPKPATVTVTGAVSVVKDAGGTVTAVKLTAKDGVYNVVLDKEGMELAKMDGKEVEVQGEVTKKGADNWIKVVTFKPVEKPKA
jgi:RNase P/RNase MRP subunit p29